jgi:hypothetical protein
MAVVPVLTAIIVFLGVVGGVLLIAAMIAMVKSSYTK